jgi:hypothetical protein
MHVKQFRLAALFAVTSAAVAIGAAPIAAADECDPTATICQGPDVQSNSSPMSFAPAPDVDMGGAPSEMELTAENDLGPQGFGGEEGHDGGHGR